MKIIVNTCILLLILSIRIAYAVPTNWNLYNHEFYNYNQLSKESTRGQNSVIIKSNPIPIDETTSSYLRTFRERDKEGGVLFQTINATKYSGKHLHISVLAKFVTFDVETFTKNYQRYLKNIIQKNNIKYNRNNRSTRNLFLDLHRLNKGNFDSFFGEKSIGLTVYAHLTKNVVVFEMTSPDNESPIDWQRFTTEIDVPTNTSYITIALWVKGTGSAYFDHVVIDEQGNKLNKIGIIKEYQYCDFCDKNDFLLYLRKSISSKGFSFENTSFEKSNN